jgi:hypothetical protein
MPGVSSGGARVGAFGGGVLRELLAIGCWLLAIVHCLMPIGTCQIMSKSLVEAKWFLGRLFEELRSCNFLY